MISKSSTPNPNSTLPASDEPAGDNYNNDRKEGGLQSAEHVASLVWNFLKAAGGLVKDLDGQDEVKLLRLRTKNNELVIVPGTMHGAALLRLLADRDADPKFILVAIHDTPPA